MADSYHGTVNFTAPSEESNALELDTTQSMVEEEDNDVTQMGKEIVEYKSVPSKSGRRKRRRLSSKVWEVFVKLPRSSDGRERNKCKLCGKVYLCERILATGNMKRHLKICPKMKRHDVDQLFESGSEGGSSSNYDRKDPQVFQELVTAAIIMHDLPLRFFEWSHIRKMIEYVSDDVNLVSKKTTEMDVLKVHRREKEVVKKTIEEAYGRVCLTAELWTAMNTDNYMCVVAHFLDKIWVLQKRMLDFYWMPTPHDVISLTNKFNRLLWEWGIDKKLCSLTLDNALSDNSFVNNLKGLLLNLRIPLVCNGDFLHINCCAHILDLIVQDGLKDINEIVHKIRESIICVKVSKELRQDFLECIKQVSLDCKKGLRQDIPTIWNLTYLMLENALYYRRAWCLLELFDNNFKLCPSASEWDKVEKSIKFFVIFYEIACIFSRTKCPTSNMYFPKMLVALVTLKQNLESEDVFLKKMTNQMYTKFYKYWADSCIILAIAVILDPRYKMKFVEFAFEKVYGDGSVQLELVRNTLYSLFSDYMTNSTETSTSKASFASGVTSTFTHGTSFDLIDTVMKEFDSSLSDDCIQKTQLELYLDEPRLDRSMDLDILRFWKVNEFRYPVLATLARDVLTIPISTVTSKSAFNIDGRNLDEESVSRSLRDGDDPTRPVAKLFLSIDPLSSSNEEFSSPQFTMPMEMIGNESGNAPKCYYSMDVSQDFTPLSVLSESSSQGNIAVEGKINYKFDMKPHQNSMKKNAKLSIERKNRFKTKNCKSFQDALLEANEVFVSFKQENKKMAKSIKELKKQNVLLDITVMELDEECEQLKIQLKEVKNQKEKLVIGNRQSLCRSLQAEKKHNSMEEQQL
ncbi:hypothetical protein LWI28_010450 [Acer negundo]|uniref:BED-type domain-containing protein n=1 Tax=Acer negundo TaxID=4023 RepID=A0AAD5NH23_ACENE|nr:hypothetical protein LWI28_010450 [Acer negundo]